MNASMRLTRITVVIGGSIAVVALAVGGYGLYRLGLTRGMNITASEPRAGDIDPATGKRVLYWHDPMVPGRRFDQPGKSPFMDMALVPVYEDGSSGESA